MHSAVPEQWSCGDSPVHRLDARAKLIPLIAFLIAVATASRALPIFAVELFTLFLAVVLWARVSVYRVLMRSAWVLPFTVTFAAISWLAGDSPRALSLLLKSYLSAFAVVIVVATTSVPALLRGFELLGAPRFLLEVGQFLYRYLFVIAITARNMTRAASARSAFEKGWAARHRRFRAIVGALAVLFARSYKQAEEIHRAMCARGFQGRLPVFAIERFQRADAKFALLASLIPVALRLAAESVAR